MTNEEEFRREVLGDLGFDMIEAMAEKAIGEDRELFQEYVAAIFEDMDDFQIKLVGIAQMWGQMALTRSDKRLFYASTAALALAGVLDGDPGDWIGVMDYADGVWAEGMGIMEEVIQDQITGLTGNEEN